MATIYSRPGEYDLEHGTGEEDIGFYRRLVEHLAARDVVELGCGSGRITRPLAEIAERLGLRITGVDLSEEMLREADAKLADLPAGCRSRVRLVHDDIARFAADPQADLIIVPCSTMAHVLELEPQLAVWRRAHANLKPGGRFVVDLAMPDFHAYAESMASPPRALVEMDIDQASEDGAHRLIRYKTTKYEAHRQRAHVRFLYDRFDMTNREEQARRYISDFESHVYFPRELQLLFLHTGFQVEATYGGYGGERFSASSRAMVMVGTREPGAGATRST